MSHESSVARRTPLYSRHQALGATLVDFAGWEMPLHYGSQVDEHHAVRRHAGVFDVSHMRAVDISGADVYRFLRWLLSADVARLAGPGHGLYSCLLNEAGGIIDDLLVYQLGEQRFRLVVNAGTAAHDVAWIRAHAAGFQVSIADRDDLAIIAVQGPQARALTAPLVPLLDAGQLLSLRHFQIVGTSAPQPEVWVARTGYTGESGFEIMLPAAMAPALWDALVAAGARPCGLGCRDTLRLEAGLNLYGQDMDETTHPFESALGSTVVLDDKRDFIGSQALRQKLQTGAARQLTGLLLLDRGVLRSHQAVMQGAERVGETTSGGYSPTLGRSIALARLPAGISGEVTVDVRGKPLRARVLAPPFVRRGQANFDLNFQTSGEG